MKITVIICTYSRAEMLKKTLDSLLAQELEERFDYEIIIVDNNSKDATKAVAESYIARFSGRLRYVFEPRQGKTYALNTGIETARGEIIAITDDDCLVDKLWLRTIDATFRKEEIDILGGKVIPYFDSEKPEWLDIDIFHGPIVCFDLGEKYLVSNNSNIYPIGANVSFKRDSCRKFGGFYNYGRGQDTAFSNRWETLGARIAYSPDVIVSHYTYPHRMKKGYIRRWYLLYGKIHQEIFKQRFLNGRRFLGIPVWLYKEFLALSLRFLKEWIMRKKNRFQIEIWVWYNMGIMLGLCNFRMNNENIR